MLPCDRYKSTPVRGKKEALTSGQISSCAEPNAGHARLTRLKLHVSTGKGILKKLIMGFYELLSDHSNGNDLNRKIDNLNPSLVEALCIAELVSQDGSYY